MKWNDYQMLFARIAAVKSKDSTQVGAALIGPQNEIRLTAFNGPPIGVKETAARRERPTKYLFASHAETNLIAFAARAGIRTEDCTVFTTHHPCASCARTLIQAGIKRVVYGDGSFQALGDEVEAATAMFEEAGVKLRRYACDEQPELPLG